MIIKLLSQLDTALPDPVVQVRLFSEHRRGAAHLRKTTVHAPVGGDDIAVVSLEKTNR